MILRNLRTLWCSEWAFNDKLHVGKLQSVEKKKKRNQLAWACRKSLHHLPDALCQQVRALIDLRLPNCTVIKERSCSVPFFLLILTLFIWFWRGHSWAQCVDRSVPSVNVWCAHVSLFSFRRVLFIPRGDLSGGCTAGSQRPQHITERSKV